MDDAKPSAAPNPAALDRFLLVGLGNPGSRYAETRHNIGFMVLEAFAKDHRIPLTGKKFDAVYGDGTFGRKRVALLLPQTFMNLSGRSVAQAVRYGTAEPGSLVVVHDEVDLPFGRIRLKWAGGNAGHNGLRSIDGSLGHGDYFRIRMGVGRPDRGNVKDYVLTRFTPPEQKELQWVINGGVEAIERLLADGLIAAQNAVHAKDYAAAP